MNKMNDKSSLPQPEHFTGYVNQVMAIEDITWGDQNSEYLVRYRGQLKVNLPQAQDMLEKDFLQYKITPIIRSDNGRTAILLNSDPIKSVVTKVFKIEETTWGDAQGGYIVRYRGHLLMESIAAYDFLAQELSSHDITPLFRKEEGQHAIILMRGVNRPTPSNPMVNLVMFLLTLLSVAFVGAMSVYTGPSGTPEEIMTGILTNLWKGWPFAVSLLGILLAHEFGHYLAGRYHKTAVTLPYFIPFPLPPFGTMGAFIQLKEAPKNKRILHDIGIAGPLAGMVVAIPVLLLGLSLSKLNTLPLSLAPGEGYTLEGNSILYLLAKFVVFKEWLPAPLSYGGLSPLLYWIRFFFTGGPIPWGGRDVLIHPVALAGWGGLLVTALNLIPAGQLDGGHIMYVLLGNKAKLLLPFILISLLALGFIWQGWWIWALLISFLGRRYAEPLDQITPLDRRRKTIAIFGLILFILLFTPVPLQLIT